MMSPTPFPTPTLSPTNAQLVQLIQQAEHQQLSINESLLLYIALHLPVPTSWQLGMYHFLTALPLPELSPMWFTILVTVGPILTLVFLYVLVVLLLKLIRFLIPLVLRRIVKVKEPEKVFLELTFPAETSKSAYATQQLYTLLHTLARQKSFLSKLLKEKKLYSLEIVATKTKGIRYIVMVDEKNKDIIKRSLLSYLPGIKIQETEDYLDQKNALGSSTTTMGVMELKLSNHFTLPLNKQKVLDEHDPMAYLTGNMTKLQEGEMIVFQIVTTPVLASIHGSITDKMHELRLRIRKGQPIMPKIQQSPLDTVLSLPGIAILWWITKMVFSFVAYMINFAIDIAMAPSEASSKHIRYAVESSVRTQEILNPYEQELQIVVKEKIDQHLFETSIRIFIATQDNDQLQSRLSGLLAGFGPMSSSYQSLTTKGGLPWFSSFTKRFVQLQNRTLSYNNPFQLNPILSTSEISDLYHFPYTDTTKTENIVKSYSSELPAPLLLKQDRDFDVVIGMNIYGGEELPIGLTFEQRQRHMVVFGGTGNGKTTMLLHMLGQDMQNGKGLAFIDPHGDAARKALLLVPEDREDDVVWIDPDEIEKPLALNLLELTPGLTENQSLREKEQIAESIISLFRRICASEFSQAGGNAFRIEHVLRNAIYTAFTVKDCTLFTIYDLLEDPIFLKETVNKLTDVRLQKFWRNIYGKAGDYQQVKMVGGVIARIGRFLHSEAARRILEQPHSSLDFDDIMNNQKILLCNLSKGNLGEDISQVLGTTIITKIQLAAMRRAKVEEEDRVPFFLYVDEFQNYATEAFVEMLSEARKYKLHLIIVEQSTSQQNEKSLIGRILANVAIVICFRTGNPEDETIMLKQFGGFVKPGEIMNLPWFHFFIKIYAQVPQEPFSGKTVPIDVPNDKEKVNRIITLSQGKYTQKYVKKTVKKETSAEVAKPKNLTKKQANTGKKSVTQPETKARKKSRLPDEE